MLDPRGPGGSLPPPSAPGRSGPWLVGLLALALPLLLLRLGAKDVWEASEGRPLESAREMRAAGDLLVQRTNGEVDLTKPPLYAWAALAMFAVAGDGEAAGRLPSVVAALASLLAVFALGRRIAGPRAGFLAAVLALTTAKLLWQARLAELETMLAAGVLWAYVAADAALEAATPAARRRAWLGAGAALAFAAAVKGPVAFLLVVPGLVAQAVVTRRVRALSTPAAALALLVAVVGLVAWPLAVSLDDPAAFDTLVGFARGENVGHRRDVLYYVGTYPLFALPWTPLVLVALPMRWARGLAPVAANRAHLPRAAFVTTFVLLSALPTKQTHYLVPVVFPMGAVLAGCALDRWLGRRADGVAFGRFLPFAAAGTFGLVAAAAVRFDVPAWTTEDAFVRGSVVMLSAAFATLVVGVVGIALLRRTGASATGLVEGALAVVLGLEAVVVGWIAPGRNPIESSRAFFGAVDATVPAGAPLAWTVFASHSDYLWHLAAARVARTGIPELVADGDDATAARVRTWLAAGGARFAIVTAAQAERLADVADVVARDDALQKKARRVALVRTKERP